jgi:streptogramin lyase
MTPTRDEPERPARRAWLAAGLALLVAAGGAGSASAAVVTRFESHWAFPFEAPYTSSITTGADGNLWFDSEGAIARMTPAGVVTEFTAGLDQDSDGTRFLAPGHDGNVWFTDIETNRVGRITPSGRVTTFTAGITRGAGPHQIAAGPDGNVWFTEPTKGWVARITPAGAVTEFSKGITPHSGIGGITAGPDGNVWFGVLADRPRIARITPAGTVTEFADGLGYASPESLAAGLDGNVWFADGASDRVGRVTPAGAITLFSKGITPRAEPNEIAAGPDGNMWFTEFEAGRIGRVTPAGAITEFSAGLRSGDLLTGITAGPGGMWFGSIAGIDRITTTPGTVVSVLTRRARVSRRGSTTVDVACGAGTEPCAGALELTITIRKTVRDGKSSFTLPKIVKLGRAKFALVPGQRATVGLRLNATGRQRLHRAKGGRLTTRYRAASSAGDARGLLKLTAAR